MSRDDDYEDDDYEEPPPPAFPVVVRLAGIIWIGIGALGVVSAVLNFAGAGAANRANPNGQNPAAGAQAAGQSIGGCCTALIAVAFVAVGYNTVTGKAKDTLGNAIGSLLLAALVACVGVAVVGFATAAANNPAGKRAPPDAGAELVIAGIIFGGVCLLYVVPGVLALVGRRDYLAWRKYHAPVKRRRRDDDD